LNKFFEFDQEFNPSLCTGNFSVEIFLKENEEKKLKKEKKESHLKMSEAFCQGFLEKVFA